MMKMKLLAMAVLCAAISLNLLEVLSLPVVTESNDSDCFEVYFECLNSSATNYTENFMNCQKDKRNAIMRIDIENEPDRGTIQAEANAVCEQLKSCENMEVPLDFFRCHSELGMTNTRSVMGIHLNSTKILVDMEEQLGAAEKARIQCEMDAEYAHKEEFGLAYLELINCLN